MRRLGRAKVNSLSRGLDSLQLHQCLLDNVSPLITQTFLVLDYTIISSIHKHLELFLSTLIVER